MGLDHEKMLKAKQGGRQTGWRPQSGDNNLHILPPHSKFIGHLEDLSNLAIQYRMHFFRIEGRQTEVTRCLGEKKESCPACIMWRQYNDATNPALKQLATAIRPADQYLFNILDRANVQTGVQHWTSNWTCWNKIMQIATNPQWGDVVAVDDNIWFIVTLTPENQSKSGYNAYEVVPQPERANISEWLNSQPDWREVLDNLESQISEYLTAEEIVKILDEIGFPPPATGFRTLPSAESSVPATQPAPPTVVSTPPPTATAAAPNPSAIAASAPPLTTPAVPSAVQTAPSAPQPGVHYDPGPAYVPRYADAERPVGAPRCYGDYKPDTHRCAPCPVATNCQMKMLNIPEE